MSEKLEGHIDHSANGSIFGWVRNTGRPLERLKVKLELSNGWSKVVSANEQREDLIAKNIGDGIYGFSAKVPFKIASHGDVFVTGTALEYNYTLEKSGRRLILEHPVSLFAGDITNNCNLRCPFCVTDYALTKGNKAMPMDLFEKAKELMPLVPDGMFWISCMHEATIHPKFIQLIESVPIKLRRKLSFTTNLCKKLDDTTLEFLARSNVHSIRISIDSINPERFSELRKGGRLETFLDNLNRFSAYVKQSKSAPAIHYISMAFNSNVDEIESVIQHCKRILPAQVHEVRFIFYQPHIATWGQKRLLTMAAWTKLKEQIKARDDFDHVQFFDPHHNTHEDFQEKRGLDEYKPSPAIFGGTCQPDNYRKADPLADGTHIPNESLSFRLRWDGLIAHEKMSEDDFLQYIQNLTPDYFYKLKIASQANSPVTWEHS